MGRLQNARAVNMPKDREAAIKKASGQGAADYETVVYEGYAPHGIALLVEAATDNVTRTAANVRMHFKDHGGNLGTSGSVARMFQKQGVFRLSPEGVDRDALELELIDHGRGARGRRGREGREAPGRALPVDRVRRDAKRARDAQAHRDLVGLRVRAGDYDEVLELVAALEDDDVQNVYSNLA